MAVFAFPFRIGDKCIGRRKVFLLMMAVLSALSAFVVVLIVGQYIPYNSCKSSIDVGLYGF